MLQFFTAHCDSLLSSYYFCDTLHAQKQMLHSVILLVSLFCITLLSPQGECKFAFYYNECSVYLLLLLLLLFNKYIYLVWMRLYGGHLHADQNI